MKTLPLLGMIGSAFFMAQALAIEPVYEGDDGIREQVFESNCLACHSSDLSGSARNGAPNGSDYDTYQAAVNNGVPAVNRAVTQGNMPPSSSRLSALNDEQKQALKNWQALGFPEKKLPVIFSTRSSTLKLPAVYIEDEKGDIVAPGLSAKMKLVPNQSTIQFELTETAELAADNAHNHNHQ